MYPPEYLDTTILLYDPEMELSYLADDVRFRFFLYISFPSVWKKGKGFCLSASICSCSYEVLLLQ